jgi:hypothetical protein
MNIVMIQGSPKKADGATVQILDYLQTALKDQHEVLRIHALRDASASVATVAEAGALVVAFPLYVDGLPSHLLSFLEGLLAERPALKAKTLLYCVVQNGFIEPEQNRLAIAMTKAFCQQAGLTFGQALAIGGGPVIGAVPLGKGPLARVGRALDDLAATIAAGESAQDRFVAPPFPRFLYILIAHISWRVQAKQAGLRSRQLRSRP